MNFLLAKPFISVYAPIDIKKATIYFRDGYAGGAGAQTGAINNGAGYAGGSSVLTVDGFTGAVTTGDLVTIAGSKASGTNVLTRHRITAHTESTGATVSITITPTLDAAVLDNAVITVQPHQLEVTIGTGNLTYTEKKNIEYIKDRGLIETVREGDEEPVDVKLDFIWDFLKSDSGETPTVEEALKNTGNASSWTSSSSDACEPYAVDIQVWYNPPCSGVKDEIVDLADFRYEQLDHNLRDAQVSVSGKCNIRAATITRVA